MSQASIRVIIDGTVFRNEENGYSVIEAHAGNKSVTVVGILPALAAGEQAEFEGDWVNHPQYGPQWKAVSCRIEKPSSELGIERFLSSGLIKGVGKATARQIVQQFGKDTLRILDENPRELTIIPGIGKKRAAMIAESYREQYGLREAMIYLQSYGITPHMAQKIGKHYGAATQDVLRENPYRLADEIDGIGFQTADRIAVSIGLPPDSPYRILSGIRFLLSDAAASDGHTYLPMEELIRKAKELLKAGDELIQMHIRELVLKNELTAVRIDETDAIFLTRLYNLETETAARLLKLRGYVQTGLNAVTEHSIRRFEQANNILFDEIQKQAVREALCNGLFIITGGPGTGKTTIINCILSLLNGEALLAAPTGRAAKRMSEATGHEAKTLHRLLEYSPEIEGFARDENNTLDTACVIVDEMSMVDIYLMRSLLRALRKGTRLILVGDADQLPSVGAGNVLGDMLQSGVIPSVRLTYIFRQKNESNIVTNAHRILKGEMPVLNQKNSDFFFDRRQYVSEAAADIVSLCEKRLPPFLRSGSAVRDIQVLAPARKGECGVINLNTLLQQALNPPSGGKPQVTFGDTVFRLGDKVMHIRNNYQLEWTTLSGEEGAGVFNGDIGYITAIDTEEHTVSVLYDDERTVDYGYGDLEELTLAYCLSIHKSQGSEFPCVVMPVVGGPPMLLTRNLFYTAITRARRLAVLVGREDCIADLVHNDHITRRWTALRQRLEDYDRMGQT